MGLCYGERCCDREDFVSKSRYSRRYISTKRKYCGQEKGVSYVQKVM